MEGKIRESRDDPHLLAEEAQVELAAGQRREQQAAREPEEEEEEEGDQEENLELRRRKSPDGNSKRRFAEPCTESEQGIRIGDRNAKATSQLRSKSPR